jgi:prepilin-type N-terminal cleavage/methylation domain-containing protein
MHERRQAGFNLIETVVASMILSGAALALSSISTNAVMGTRLNQHHQMAASIMENKLAQIDFMGIDEFIELGQTEGMIEELEPGYRWQVVTEYQGTDNLYLVSITVSWLEGRRPYQLTAQTMLNGASLLTTSSETEGP